MKTSTHRTRSRKPRFSSRELAAAALAVSLAWGTGLGCASPSPDAGFRVKAHKHRAVWVRGPAIGLTRHSVWAPGPYCWKKKGRRWVCPAN